jgi:2-polyprenyl-3-methyl-5-hydroxy-6-metoxy-1,4-benzoquinol methylase
VRPAGKGRGGIHVVVRNCRTICRFVCMNSSATPPQGRQFDFGQNWKEYSQHAITPARVEAAAQDFMRLHDGVPLAGRSFLDIGFGQGLSLLLARRASARAIGCDVNPKCAQALDLTRRYFPEQTGEIPILVGSILETSTVDRLREIAPGGDGLYDVVHSWGVLHHTGDMACALRHAASLVRPGGHLVIAIYNRHWSSRPWLWIKWGYVHGPAWLQKALVAALYPVIYAAKWLVTRRDPKQQQRGMEFYYNVVDWIGGYPYEYASVSEMTARLKGLGFSVSKTVNAEVPTGCNEFVFRRAGIV